jgi:hypothetical protein
LLANAIQVDQDVQPVLSVYLLSQTGHCVQSGMSVLHGALVADDPDGMCVCVCVCGGLYALETVEASKT